MEFFSQRGLLVEKMIKLGIGIQVQIVEKFLTKHIGLFHFFIDFPSWIH